MNKHYVAMLKSTGEEYPIIQGNMDILTCEPLKLIVKVPEDNLSDWEIREIEE